MLMRRAGLQGVTGRRKWKRIKPDNIAIDLVQRDFTRHGPNQLWVTDITEHPTREGRSTAASSWTPIPGGSCYDNSMIESFWSRMQIELLDRKKWNTRIDALNTTEPDSGSADSDDKAAQALALLAWEIYHDLPTQDPHRRRTEVVRPITLTADPV